VGKKSFGKESTIEGFFQNVRDLTSLNEAKERSVAAEPFETGTSRSGSNQPDARSQLQLRGCFELCNPLFFDGGGE
jgi:hypothetical protein